MCVLEEPPYPLKNSRKFIKSLRKMPKITAAEIYQLFRTATRVRLFSLCPDNAFLLTQESKLAPNPSVRLLTVSRTPKTPARQIDCQESAHSFTSLSYRLGLHTELLGMSVQATKTPQDLQLHRIHCVEAGWSRQQLTPETYCS